MDKFCNLHLHSDASLGDSVIKIPNLIEKLDEYGQQYVALTDHSSLMNHYALQQACKGRKVTPLFGNEFYCKTTLEKPLDKNRYHLVLIAQSEQGLENIRKKQRIAVANHFYYKPLLPHQILFEDTEDIFVSTACALSYINHNFLTGNDDEAYSFFNKLLDNFGKNNVAIELQYHPTWIDDNGVHTQNILNQKLIEMYDNTDAKYIINTFDSHFLENKDRIIRKKIQSIAWKKSEDEISDSLKSNCLGNTKLSYQFAKESGIEDENLIQKCIDNTYKISQQCAFETKDNDPIVPEFTFHREFKKIFCKEIY